MSKRERRSELFCPKDFHYYGGVDVCLLFCRKKVCSVFKKLKNSECQRSLSNKVKKEGGYGWRVGGRKQTAYDF